MAIRFYNKDCNYRLAEKRRIGAWIRAAIEEESLQTGDITYIFCSPEHHIGINRQYLGHDYNTDVITFDYSDLKDTRTVSGDIFIDPATVSLNASEYGATPRQEMLRVIVHGVMHLCGYKDKSEKEAKTMRSKEDHYLAKF